MDPVERAGGQEQDRQERGVPDRYVFDGISENTRVDCRGESKNDTEHFQKQTTSSASG